MEPAEQSPATKPSTYADQVPPVPSGFYFPSFPKALQCVVCLAPWRAPVTFHPCGHTACRGCVHDDLSQCPGCGTPCARFQYPASDAVAEARAIPLICEHCSWSGPREDAPRHTCQARQHDVALALLRKDPGNAKGWFMLGASLKPSSPPVDIAGVKFTKVQCYVRAIDIDPHSALAWGNLGACLDATTTVTFSNGAQCSKRACNVRALNLNPRLPIVWFNLGNTMAKGDTEDVNGSPVFKDTCYVRALELDPRMHAAWHNLGLCLERELVIDLGDREYDAAMCFITAILIKPDFAESWSKLAVVGPQQRTFLGRRWTQKECAAKALSLNKTLAEPWVVLNKIMIKADDFVEISGKMYSKQAVERRAARAAQAPAQRPQANPPPRRSASQSSRSSRGSSGSSGRGSQPGTPRRDAGGCSVM